MKNLSTAISLILVFLSLLPVGGVIDARNAPTLPEPTSIYDIQYTADPSGDSPYAGQEVIVTGFVTGVFFNGYFVAEATGPWHAIYVYSQKNAPNVGDEVEVTGTVQEYYGMTEIVDISGYQVLSSGHGINPLILEVGMVAQEAYESVLIQVEDVSVTGLEDNGEWVISNGLASIPCDDMVDYIYFPQLGDDLESVTGILYYSYGDFKIEPRKTNDIAGVVIPHYALTGDIITMNDERAVILDSYLEILGDEIIGVHSVQPPGIQVFPTDGLIFPGLIDAHNHPHYNVLDLIPFDQNFNDRYEWQSYPLYDAFKNQYYDIRDYGGYQSQMTDLFKLAEVRALTAGTTMIEGLNLYGHQYDGFARKGMVINNAERFPSRIYSEVFPLNKDQTFWDEKQAEYWERFVIHLSEGTNQAALQEFSTWQSMGMLDARTSIIHGVPYGSTEWLAMAQSNASLIWSPASNLRLYGATAHIPGALAAGVNVALAPDWTESGTLNILAEMKLADQINESLWGGAITPQQFAELVTRNAALALGVEDWAGQIEPGFQADIVVISGDDQEPYTALLSARPADVKLTIVNGRPMYGDPGLMGQFPFLAQLEEFSVGGVRKQLAIQVESHTIPESDISFSEVVYELEEAYEASDPKVCDFLGIERQLSWRLSLPLVVHHHCAICLK